MIEFVMAGASAISLGTTNMIYPTRSFELINQFENYLKNNNYSNINEIKGLAHK